MSEEIKRNKRDPGVVKRNKIYQSLKKLWVKRLRYSCDYVMYSGGADSTAALIIAMHFHSLEKIYKPRPPVAVHFNHGTEPSSEMEKHCVTYCEKIGVRSIVHKLPTEPIPKGCSEEFILSQRRYDGLKAVMLMETNWTCRYGLEFISGHHKDDVEESIILGLYRGGDPTFLKGPGVLREVGCVAFSPTSNRREKVTNTVNRPFLGVSKEDLVDLAKHLASEMDIPFEYYEDPSNTDTQYTRNKIRHEIIPHLERNNLSLPIDAIVYNQTVADAMEELAMSALSYLDTSPLSNPLHGKKLKADDVWEKWLKCEEERLHIFPNVKSLGWVSGNVKLHSIHLKYIRVKLSAYGLVIPANCSRSILDSILDTGGTREVKVEVQKGLYILYTGYGYYLTRK